MCYTKRKLGERQLGSSTDDKHGDKREGDRPLSSVNFPGCFLTPVTLPVTSDPFWLEFVINQSRDVWNEILGILFFRSTLLLCHPEMEKCTGSSNTRSQEYPGSMLSKPW